MANRLLLYIEHPHLIVKRLGVPLLIKYGQNLCDLLYVKLMFWLKMGRRLKLNPPQLFNDKLQWRKLYDHNPLYPQLTDKASVKEHVARRIGEQYIIPTIAVYDSLEAVDWEALPNQFVIKTTAGGSGDGVCVVRDKQHCDLDAVKAKLRNAVHIDLWHDYREWIYREIPQRIIVEQYMQNGTDDTLTDYKFTCFDGMVHDVMVCLDRGTGDTKFYFFDRQWQLLRINKRGIEAPEGFTIPKPACMDEMFEIAAKLSKGLSYARIDLYSINDHPYFGEITLLPNSGYGINFLPETERLYGSLFKLPNG